VTTDDALAQLGESSAEAVAGVLQMYAPDAVERGAVSVAGADVDPLAGIRAPAVVASVSYVDGVKGGNLFVISVAGARRLAAAMMGMSEPEGGIDGPLSELELSAVSEASNQMMAAAAGATSKVLGEEVEISVPTTQLLDSLASSESLYEKTPHQTHVSFSIFGESCRLVQLVPNAFVVRMGRALGEQAGALLAEQGSADIDGFSGGDVLRGVSLRVWAELGRATMPVGRAVGLASGSVVELDRGVEDPVDLYVNGRRFAVGRLVLADDGEWAVRIEAITPDPTIVPPLQEGVR
jgi:flagellar motor switch protein FliN/FliY